MRYEYGNGKGQKPGSPDMMAYSPKGLLLAKAIEQPSTRSPGELVKYFQQCSCLITTILQPIPCNYGGLIMTPSWLPSLLAV